MALVHHSEQNQQPIYVYILQGVRGWSYCGITHDLVGRFFAHNKGLSKSTASNRPYVLKWVVTTSSRSNARSLEVLIKSFGVQKFLKCAKYKIVWGGDKQLMQIFNEGKMIRKGSVGVGRERRKGSYRSVPNDSNVSASK